MTLQYLIFYLFFQNVNCGNLEIELVKELFENYNKNLRPVHKASNFIDRDMRIVLASILKLDHLSPPAGVRHGERDDGPHNP